jgi:hypothetical protein
MRENKSKVEEYCGKLLHHSFWRKPRLNPQEVELKKVKLGFKPLPNKNAVKQRGGISSLLCCVFWIETLYSLD